MVGNLGLDKGKEIATIVIENVDADFTSEEEVLNTEIDLDNFLLEKLLAAPSEFAGQVHVNELPKTFFS